MAEAFEFTWRKVPPHRLAIVSSHPVQYNVPLFRRLAAQREIELTVLYISRLGLPNSHLQFRNFDRRIVWDIDLLEGYHHKVMWNPVAAHPQRRSSMLAPGLVRELSPERYDAVVVYGWGHPAYILAFLTCRARGIPFLLYSDTDVRHTGTTRALRRVRAPMLRRLCRWAAGALYCGTFNRDFYIRQGMSPERLWFSPWAVDNDRLGSGDRARGRKAFGLRDDLCYFLFVGTLIPRKRPVEHVAAVAALRRRGARVGLIMAGTGELEREVAEAAEASGIEDVKLLSFVNQAELPDLYAAADVFFLMSRRDPRGAVVHEAMAAGLSVVVSRGTGVWGPGDLVRHGQEGFVVHPDDETEVLAACEQLLDPAVRERMGRAARERVQKWSYETAARGWQEALRAVT